MSLNYQDPWIMRIEWKRKYKGERKKEEEFINYSNLMKINVQEDNIIIYNEDIKLHIIYNLYLHHISSCI